MGNPQVFFCQSVPAPANTVPLWVWVRLPPHVSAGHCGFYGSPQISTADYIFGILFKYIKYRLSTFTVICSPSARIWSEGGGNSSPPTCVCSERGARGAFSLSPSSLHPVSTPQAVSHGGSWGCCCDGGPQASSIIVVVCCLSLLLLLFPPAIHPTSSCS